MGGYLWAWLASEVSMINCEHMNYSPIYIMRLMEAWAEYVYSDRNKHDACVADEEYSRRCRGFEH